MSLLSCPDFYMPHAALSIYEDTCCSGICDTREPQQPACRLPRLRVQPHHALLEDFSLGAAVLTCLPTHMLTAVQERPTFSDLREELTNLAGQDEDFYLDPQSDDDEYQYSHSQNNKEQEVLSCGGAMSSLSLCVTCRLSHSRVVG